MWRLAVCADAGFHLLAHSRSWIDNENGIHDRSKLHWNQVLGLCGKRFLLLRDMQVHSSDSIGALLTTPLNVRMNDHASK